MMIRKCGYALLIGSLALGLTACGGTKEKKETEKQATATEVVSSTEEKDPENESVVTGSETEQQEDKTEEAASGAEKSSPDTFLTKNEEGFYEIGSAEDFVEFARLINAEIPDVIEQSGNNWGYQMSVEENAILTADIDLTDAFTGENAALLPVGGSYVHTSKKDGQVYNIAGSFAGEFDGNGHMISGVHMKSETYGESVGLFRLGPPEDDKKEVYIHDLTIADSSFSGRNYAGAIAGGLPARCIIENCTVAETVTVETPIEKRGELALGAAGGLAGVARQGYDAVLRGCISYATVSGATAGGILGDCISFTSVIGCDNYGAVTGITAGGIVGAHEGDNYYNGLVIGCVNYGTVTASEGEYARACGIVGDNRSTIRYCVNAGVVDGKSEDSYAITQKKDGSIASCGNIGEIRGTSTLSNHLAYSWELGTYESKTEEEMNAIRGCTGEILMGQTEVEVTPAKVSDAADGTLLKMLQDIGSEHGYGGWKQGEQFPVWDGESGLDKAAQ